MAPELHNTPGHRAVEILASKLRRRSVFIRHKKYSHSSWRCGCALRQIVGAREAALETVLVLRQIVSKARFSNIEQLVALIREVGRRLAEAQPKGLDCICMYSLVSNHLIFVTRTHCGQHRPESAA